MIRMTPKMLSSWSQIKHSSKLHHRCQLHAMRAKWVEQWMQSPTYRGHVERYIMHHQFMYQHPSRLDVLPIFHLYPVFLSMMLVIYGQNHCWRQLEPGLLKWQGMSFCSSLSTWHNYSNLLVWNKSCTIMWLVTHTHVIYVTLTHKFLNGWLQAYTLCHPSTSHKHTASDRLSIW